MTIFSFVFIFMVASTVIPLALFLIRKANEAAGAKNQNKQQTNTSDFKIPDIFVGSDDGKPVVVDPREFLRRVMKGEHIDEGSQNKGYEARYRRLEYYEDEETEAEKVYRTFREEVENTSGVFEEDEIYNPHCAFEGNDSKIAEEHRHGNDAIKGAIRETRNHANLPVNELARGFVMSEILGKPVALKSFGKENF